ncbi:MAG: RsmB/NOP family class I SAM-dependent RNA methyltransferase [Pseudomonadota bacterium]
MRLGGHLSAAIEVIEEVEGRHRPVSEALKDWGNTHRFAGSGDRAAIGNLVYDLFRKRRSLAFLAGSDKPEALVSGLLIHEWNMTPAKLIDTLRDDKFAPDLPAESELETISGRNLDDAPFAVQADLPDFLAGDFEDQFGEEWVREGKALAGRPPLDIRVNSLKASLEKVEKQLARFKAKKSPIARMGLRIQPGTGARRLPNVQAEEGYRKGFFEVQDEGSQIAADLVFARPGEQVMDFCAGAGGKTLALAAAMENKGQIHAYDIDRHRLQPIYERLKRAGVRNVQVHAPVPDGVPEGLSALQGRMDRVVVDAPCSGSGTWRRHPEAKWKLNAEAIEKRTSEQADVLEEAALYVKPGGYLIYITCSVLAAENEAQLFTFAETNPDYEIVSLGEVWQDLFGFDKPQPWSTDLNAITLTPAATGTDGFFVSVMWRAP